MSYADYTAANDPIVRARQLADRLNRATEQCRAERAHLGALLAEAAITGAAIAIIFEELALIRSGGGPS